MLGMFSQGSQVSDVQVADYSMRMALFKACPWAEYLTRAGWTSDGKYVYAMVLDRLQQRQAVMLIPPSSFYDYEGKGSCSPHMQCIYEETTDLWINGVLPSQVWVDERRGLVFFMAMKDSPLESH
ncbi:dipeptidyl peptidase 9, partial [Elysia marginata]